MDIPNAFIGKKEQPSAAELSAALGPSESVWAALIQQMTSDAGSLTQEWNGVCVNKYGWSLRLKQKSRNIVHLSPCSGCFRVAFALGQKAVDAAHQAHLPKAVDKALAEAPRYPEGTGLRLLVKRNADLPAIRKLAQIKIAN
jgi:hypothetical protein